jgi:uncharacterized RDD family membrane protein YckC
MAPQAAPGRPTLQPAKPPDLRHATQAQFAFQDRPALKVVAFDAFAPARSETRRQSGTGAASRTGRNGQSRRTPRQSGALEGQGALDFLPPAPAKPRTLGTTVDAVIFCEAPVARRMHRAIAAALDWAIVLIAYGLFLAVFRLAGGQFVLNRTTLMVFAGDLALIAVAYGFAWVLAGSETAGMRWTRLRLITFDGFPPDMKHRLARFAGSCLSMCTVIGLLWSLGDEESLTWQDHISRTFPTPHESEMDVLRRR